MTAPFTPDRFQTEAVAHIGQGKSVVVVAPTGAGKTYVAEQAVALVVERGERAFYTTPIKALSNQKYSDFRAAYGQERVGLLTGDNVINPEAPIVVMTTEVLRNMIYAESTALDGLAVVVLDEVHYLQNRYRGSVWEEVIIHLPNHIPLVCLSATIANPEEFTAWVRSRRDGNTELVIETHRPVPLESMYMLKDRHRDGAVAVFPVFQGKRANPQVSRLLQKGRGRHRRFAPPRRLEVIEELQHDALLPAIYFIFSRAGCDQAAEFVAGAGLGLTTPGERAEIRERVGTLTEHLPPEDLTALGYDSWLERLERGVAAHHAGMVPAFKETVEDVFAAGLAKVVFATETLSLGINMPARTVVLERLSKFTGEAHEILQPGDYTQLTGRAGRRGIDVMGTAVVLHNMDIPFERVAGIAALGSHPLESSFQPTYNMAANLIANYSQEAAERLLSASFAQFRSELRRTELEDRLREREEEAGHFGRQAECDRGDIWAFVESADGAPLNQLQTLRDFAQQFREGDVLRPGRDPSGRWVLLARGWGANPRMVFVDEDGAEQRVSADRLDPSVAIVGLMELPTPVRSRDGGYRNSVARRLREWSPDPAFVVREHQTNDGDGVGGCPRLADHLVAVRRYQRVDKDIRRLRRRVDRSREGLVPMFRSILSLLGQWGYVAGWSLTDKGRRLRFIYNELDLLLVETVARGLLDDLDGPHLAALTSLFTYEARRSEGIETEPPPGIGDRADEIRQMARRLIDAETAEGLPESRMPEPGFAAIAHAWAAGHPLEDLFTDELAAGDFVRNCRQLIDVLRQVRDEFPGLRSAAAEAIKAIDRGVVAAGGRA
jgi:ATP-dependent RNA helicase HelY